MSEIYKIQVNDSEPIEVSQQVYEVSFCFNEMLKEKDNEIERLNNIINELEKYLYKIKETSTPQERIMAKFVLKYIDELKGIKPYDELDEILELERDNLELKGSDK